MKDALGTEKPGSLVEIDGFPYNLFEGWDIDQVKADAKQAEKDKPASFRCRHGWHDFEIIAKPEPLPPVTDDGRLLAHYVYLSSRDLKRCSRCGKIGISYRY